MPKALIASLAAVFVLVLVPAALADVGKRADARFATFNASLNRSVAGQLITDLSTPANQQARTPPRRSSASGPTCS